MKTPVVWDMMLFTLVYKCQIFCGVYRVLLGSSPARPHFAEKHDTLMVRREIWEMCNGRNIVESLKEIRNGNFSVRRWKNAWGVWAKLEISSVGVS